MSCPELHLASPHTYEAVPLNEAENWHGRRWQPACGRDGDIVILSLDESDICYTPGESIPKDCPRKRLGLALVNFDT